MSRNKSKNLKVIVILGPTASGKSELSVKLAKKINGEIISADSRQVYKGLDIGSGKVEGGWYKKLKSQKSKVKTATKNLKIFIYKDIPHHCIDFVSPKKVFTAAEFKKCGQKAIDDIISRGKIPIVSGGTGFYINALLNSFKMPEVPPSWQLRKKLEKKSPADLFETLKKLDPRRAESIDSKNKRRLIRAIEIVEKTGKPIPPLIKTPNQNVLFLGLKHRPETLKKRIEKRVEEMLKNGLIKEVQKLRKQGLTWKRIYELGFEYKYPALYLQKKIPSRQKRDEARPDKHRGGNQEEMLAALKKENWRYAKRQMTWFRRNRKIHWLVPSEVEGIKSPACAKASAGKQKEAEKLVKKFLK